ncbi:predicted protein [Postia placenta Mad-698-R]|nr:predicted protein [Postia placenta Mad-698-R]
MSDSSTDEAQILQSDQYSLIEYYIEVMAMSLFAYDSILSFNLEWRAVWSRKITGATVLYLALRYVTLMNVIMFVVATTVIPCEGYFITTQVYIGTACGTYIAQAAFASLRVYAIDGRRWTKATVVMMLGLVPVATNIASIQPPVYVISLINASFTSFVLSDTHTPHSRVILLLVTRICAFMSNLLVVISTWQATRADRAVTALNSRKSLIAVLFLDGIVHFALVFGLNAADVVVTLLMGEHFDMSDAVELISTVVLCHFFLNLRRLSSSPDINDSSMPSPGSSSLNFASRVIGNLGEMLEDSPGAFEDDLDCEPDAYLDAREAHSANDGHDGANSPSDAQAATAAICRREMYEGSTANRQALAAPDQGFNRRTVDTV